MPEAYPHLRFEREQPVTEKRPGRHPPSNPPTDIIGHACNLQLSLSQARVESKKCIQGFDDRPLFKLQIGAISAEQIEQGFPGVEVISQESGGYALIFASQNALTEFEARLTTLANGKIPKYPQLLYALQAFECWTREDRMGWALTNDGFPKKEPFKIDVELWPMASAKERSDLIQSFETWIQSIGAQSLDKINTEGLILYRIKCSLKQAELILKLRDARSVDLPPRHDLSIEALRADLQDIPEPVPPPDNAPFLAILDSGIAEGHPLLRQALADAQGFLDPDRESHDDEGHGTHVAGIALYGDLEECWRSKYFNPEIRLLSGRILDKNAEANDILIENIIIEAVTYFKQTYGCKIFNLSYGDLNKPYLGGRMGGLAYTIDRLSRELDVLFIVPTGNYPNPPLSSLQQDYPNYLLSPEGSLIDPAPALNAITVGSIARWDKTNYSSNYEDDPREKPIAIHDQISPFSRCGGSVKEAVKPELVAYGGNWALHQTTGQLIKRRLGEISTSVDHSSGNLLSERSGTSFAAPYIAHLAAKILNNLPSGASCELIRAILIANAKIPIACNVLFSNEEAILGKTVGYGTVDSSGLFRSSEEEVTLIDEAAITNKCNHFYEVPIPNSLYLEGKRSRTRELTVSLAYCPPTRTTRTDYKAVRIEFRLVEADDLETVSKMFNKATPDDEYSKIPELGCNKFCYGSSLRSKGTVQSSSWIIKRSRTKKLFVVVTRNDYPWANLDNKENYALVIKISDHENEEARLYSQIKAMLQVRERAKIKL